MPSRETYMEQRERMVFRCVYCGYKPINDLPALMDHEYRCEFKKLRRKDWKLHYMRWRGDV